MNIKQAKDEIRHTVQAYLTKDALGDYAIPVVRQRPILLIGPPGIGKTAIMSQVARECGVALVSYTITHHTRQSAIGLPFIEKKNFGGKEYSITEYTMSEIVASIYEKMEATSTGFDRKQPGSKKEFCLSMRSTVYPRHWHRLCCSFCRAKLSAITRFLRDG